MTTPQPPSSAPSAEAGTRDAKLLRVAIWVAIGALIAAAIVCVVMVLVGSASGIIGRAFLTVLLLAAFAGVALLDTYLARRRPVWFALTSMIVWVATLLIGAVMIWMPSHPTAGFSGGVDGAQRFLSFLLIVLILQLGVLHVRLYLKAWERNRTAFTTSVTWVTVILVALLAIMLVFPLILQEWVRFHDIYWRLAVSVAILAAVGTALVPLVNALFASHSPRPAPAPGVYSWPTYPDGRTPLPAFPDGRPDWSAAYGTPGAPGAPAAAPAQGSAPAQSPVDPSWPAPAPGGEVPPRPPLPGQQQE